MRHCDCCQREFTRTRHQSMTCPFCGYNACAKLGTTEPRSQRSLVAIEEAEESPARLEYDYSEESQP